MPMRRGPTSNFIQVPRGCRDKRNLKDDDDDSGSYAYEFSSGCQWRERLNGIESLHSAELRDSIDRFATRHAYTDSTKAFQNYVLSNILEVVMYITHPLYPTPMRRGAEAYLLGLIEHFYPNYSGFFLQPPGWESKYYCYSNSHAESHPITIIDCIPNTTAHLCPIYENTRFSALLPRYAARLLRNEQVLLWEAALQQYVIAMKEVATNTSKMGWKGHSSWVDPQNPDHEWLYLQYRLNKYNERLIFFPRPFAAMILDGRFRSERLELLLLKYINDGEEPNEQLVRKLAEAHEQFRLATACQTLRNDGYKNWTEDDFAKKSNHPKHPGHCCDAWREFFKNKWNDLGGRMPRILPVCF